MTVNVRWADEQRTLLLFDIKDEWTWEDFYPAYETAMRLVVSTSAIIDIITDLRHISGTPGDLFAHVRHFSRQRPANVGLNVIITENAATIALARVAMRLFPAYDQKLQFARSMDEAHAIIAEAVANRNGEPLTGAE